MRSPEQVYFVAGIGDYKGRLDPLTKVPEELCRMRECLEALGFSDGAPELTAAAAEVDPFQLLDAVARWIASRSEALRSEDIPPARVLIYLTGHGDLDRHSRRFVITCRDYDPKVDLATGKVDPAQFVDRFCADHAEGVADEILLIVDCCMSGHGVAEAMRKILDDWVLPGDRLKLWMVGSTYAVETAEQLRFVSAFAEAVDTAPASSPHIEILRLKDRISAISGQRVIALPTPAVGSGTVLPTPSHMPPVGPTWLSGEWERWSAPARGVGAGETVGWYFTGRNDVMAALCAAVDPAASDRRPRLVVGTAGTGKSAVLGRFAISGMPASEVPLVARRGPLPAVGSVRVAVRIREGWTVEGIRGRIAEQVGAPVDGSSPIQDLFTDLGSPVGVVLDDIDRCADPVALMAEVVSPLAALPNVRLVMSARARPPGVDDAVVLDLDVEYAVRVEDLSAYVITRLTRTPGSPLAGDLVHPAARKIARMLAPLCIDNFGIAAKALKNLVRPASYQLWMNDPVENSRAQTARLVLDLFADVLRAHGRGAEDLLPPLQLWPGEWLPESLWLELSDAVNQFSSADIAAVAAAAPALLVGKVVDGENWWKLRSTPPQVESPPDTVVERLLDAVPEDDHGKLWAQAHPHLLRLLVRWICLPKCAELTRLLDDSDFLTTVAPVGARIDANTHHEDTRVRVNIWRHLHGGDMDADARKVVLSLLADWERLPMRAPRHPSSVTVDWSVPAVEGTGVVTGLAANPTTLATAHDDATVRLWVAEGEDEPKEIAVDRHTRLAGSVALSGSGTPTAIASWLDGRLSLLTGDGARDLGSTGRAKTESLAFVADGEVALISAGRLLGLDTTSAAQRTTWAPVALRITRLAIGPVTESTTVFVGTRDGELLVRDYGRESTTGMLHRLDGAIVALASSPSGHTVAALGVNGDLVVHLPGAPPSRLDAAVRQPAVIAVSDRWLCVGQEYRTTELAVYSHDDLREPVLRLFFPEALAGVAFRADDSLLLSAVGGMAQLNLSSIHRGD